MFKGLTKNGEGLQVDRWRCDCSAVIKRAKFLEDMISGRIIEESRHDECIIEDFHIKRLVSGVGCFKRLTLFQLTALTRNTRATHMKPEVYLYLFVRLKTMHAGLSAETGPGQCAVCENTQDQKQCNQYIRSFSMSHKVVTHKTKRSHYFSLPRSDGLQNIRSTSKKTARLQMRKYLRNV
jgi:hypothetical protein